MAEIKKVIGLMSGTSLDGIDAAVLETDGEGFAVSGPALTVPYAPELRAILRGAMDVAAKAGGAARQLDSVREAEIRLTDAHAEVVQRLMQEAGLAPHEIAYLGFHGQTILHRPAERLTVQLGEGDRLARATGVSVVNDFRGADVAAGGQGAPLVPLYHAALVRARPHAGPVVVVNIGGVANVTFVGTDGELLAFDTGPGNAPIDDWAMRHLGVPVDRDGVLARRGRVHADILYAMLRHPYFDVSPPKSLDRLDFTFDAVNKLSPSDGAATLTEFTAASLARAIEHFPAVPMTWIICGGGRRNPALMMALRRRLNNVAAEELGWRGDFLEAEAFAYLAIRSVKNLPLSLPTTTGVPHPMTGGRVHEYRA